MYSCRVKESERRGGGRAREGEEQRGREGGRQRKERRDTRQEGKGDGREGK